MTNHISEARDNVQASICYRSKALECEVGQIQLPTGHAYLPAQLAVAYEYEPLKRQFGEKAEMIRQANSTHTVVHKYDNVAMAVSYATADMLDAFFMREWALMKAGNCSAEDFYHWERDEEDYKGYQMWKTVFSRHMEIPFAPSRQDMMGDGDFESVVLMSEGGIDPRSGHVLETLLWRMTESFIWRSHEHNVVLNFYKGGESDMAWGRGPILQMKDIDRILIEFEETTISEQAAIAPS